MMVILQLQSRIPQARLVLEVREVSRRAGQPRALGCAGRRL
jgi:hypothetical protein